MSGAKLSGGRTALSELLRALQPYRKKLCAILLLAIIASTLNVIAPAIIKKLSDVIVSAGVAHAPIGMERIAHYGIILAGMYLTASLLSLAQNFMTARSTAAVTHNYRSRINSKINRLPMAYFDRHSVGDTLSRMTNDVDTLGQGLSDSLNSMITGMVMVFGTIVMMFVIHWRMALLVLAMMPVSMAVIFMTIRFSQKYFVQQQKGLGSVNGQLEEAFSNHTVVYAFSGQQRAQEHFAEINGALSRSMARANFFSSVLHPVVNFMGNLPYIMICLFGGYLAVCSANVSFVTTILIFITYMNSFNNQIGSLANLSSVLQANAAAHSRIMEFSESNEEVVENKTP